MRYSETDIKDLRPSLGVRIIVAGGRDFDDSEMMCDALARFPDILISEFVNGMADGADQLAREHARRRGRKVHPFPVTSEEWDELGKKAGPMRNEKMAIFANEKGRGVLIAFWDGRSTGTRSMINLALKHGLEVHVYRYSK